MTLKIYTTSLANVEREQHRGLYVADAEHGWRLDCDYLDLTRGLREAIRIEREARREADRTLRRFITADGIEAMRVFKNSPTLGRDAQVKEDAERGGSDGC